MNGNPKGHKALEMSVGSFSQDQLLEYADRYGTPLYVYDGDLIVHKFHKFHTAFTKEYDHIRVYYALKANTNISIVSLLRNAGARAECISMGELMLALKLDFPSDELLFTSNSKSPLELSYAVTHGVLVNLDSLADLHNLIAVAERLQTRVRVSFRLNADVEPDTHRHIATSHQSTKFGIMDDQIEEAYRLARDTPLIDVCGMHSHIGSQILAYDSFSKNIERILAACHMLKQNLNIELEFINAGGGLGLSYDDEETALEPAIVAKDVCGRVKRMAKKLGYLPQLWLEPGRYFTGDAGILLARVNSVKKTPYNFFINVDTGFNHLLRPLLYEAHHRIKILGRYKNVALFDVAGNICETGDILAIDRLLPEPEPGDTMAFLDVGAYGFSMASEFNMFPLPIEIMVRGGKDELIRTRGSLEDMLRNQILLKDL